MSTYWKENLKGKSCCMDCIRTMTQCISLHAYDQGFPNSSGGDGGLTCVYKESEVKTKMVQVQWLQPKMKFLVHQNKFLAGGGDSSHPHQYGKPSQHVWSLINFKRARKSLPHHNISPLFLCLCEARWECYT